MWVNFSKADSNVTQLFWSLIKWRCVTYNIVKKNWYGWTTAIPTASTISDSDIGWVNFLQYRILIKGLLKLIRGSKWWHHVLGMELYDLEPVGSKYLLAYFAPLSFLSGVLSSSITQKIYNLETQRVSCWSQSQPDLKAWKLLIWRKVKNCFFFGFFGNSQAVGIRNFKRCNLDITKWAFF